MLTKEEMQSNLNSVQTRIEAACKRANRLSSDVTLIAVSKMNPLEAVELAAECGAKVFGENKVQEMCGKIDQAKADYEWHLIGHLQTNKVKYVIGRVAMIHSVDSIKLAEAIDKESAKKGVVTDILIEVNIGGEETKFGVSAKDTYELVEHINLLKNIRLRGLMTVAPPVNKPDDARPYFKLMRELFVDINNKNYDNIYMNVLSMGMTGDFEVAIEEGATHVRVGTGIFGARDYSNQK